MEKSKFHSKKFYNINCSFCPSHHSNTKRRHDTQPTLNERHLKSLYGPVPDPIKIFTPCYFRSILIDCSRFFNQSECSNEAWCKITLKVIFIGPALVTGCGTVGRVVASDTSWPGFEWSRQQILQSNMFTLTKLKQKEA